MTEAVLKPDREARVIQRTGAGPDPTRGARPATAVGETAVEDGDEWSGESRIGKVRAIDSPQRRSRRRSRNLAVALALLAFAIIMFLVTIVKFEEQMYNNDMSRTPGEPRSPRVSTTGVAAVSRIETFGRGLAMTVSLFGDTKGMEAVFDRGGDRAGPGDG